MYKTDDLTEEATIVGHDKPGRKVNSTKQATVRRQATGQKSPEGQIDHQQKSSLPPKSAKNKASHLHQESEADQRPAKRSRTANSGSGVRYLSFCLLQAAVRDLISWNWLVRMTRASHHDSASFRNIKLSLARSFRLSFSLTIIA